MNPTIKNDLVLRAARGERTPRTPIWLMRQAGRTDPEYNRLKRESGLSLGALFKHPELAAQISLLPRRFGVDAIIYFQDILTPLAPMGAPFDFVPGPRFENPIRNADDVARLVPYDVARELPFISEIFRLVREELDGELPVLGFAGAPLTLAVFLAEGGSFGDDAAHARGLMEDAPNLLHALLEKLTVVTIDYLLLQINSGADAVQLFESAAHLLTRKQYSEFALPYQQRVFDAIKGKVPSIVFAREWDNIASLGASGADVVSLPASVSVSDARKALGVHRPLQGNLDNRLLVNGSKDSIEQAARVCIQEGQHNGHIFNLSHGLLSDTPFENVLHLIDVVKKTKVRDET